MLYKCSITKRCLLPVELLIIQPQRNCIINYYNRVLTVQSCVIVNSDSPSYRRMIIVWRVLYELLLLYVLLKGQLSFELYNRFSQWKVLSRLVELSIIQSQGDSSINCRNSVLISNNWRDILLIVKYLYI